MIINYIDLEKIILYLYQMYNMEYSFDTYHFIIYENLFFLFNELDILLLFISKMIITIIIMFDIFFTFDFIIELYFNYI